MEDDEKVNVLSAAPEGIQLIIDLETKLDNVGDQNEKTDIYKSDLINNDDVKSILNKDFEKESISKETFPIEIINSVSKMKQNELDKIEINSLQNDLKKLILSEAEKTREMMTEILKVKNDPNELVSMQPRQYQPNYGGNQFNIEHLHIQSGQTLKSKNEENELEVIKEFFLFLKNKSSGKTDFDETQIVDTLIKNAENFQQKAESSADQNKQLSKVINSPMLIKLLKYEL